MNDATGRGRESGHGLERGRGRRLALLGACSLLLFWAPLLAPLIQGWTFLEAGLALRRGEPRRRIAALALGASLAGFALFLATEYLWVA
jgi:hypothetical protein